MCPFSDPKFELPLNTPCPICGALGNNPEEIEEKCIDEGPDFS